MKSTTGTFRPVVTADGAGIVSYAGAALLRELADESGLTRGWTPALLDTYKGSPVHLPGRVLTDLAVTLADGGDCLADLAALRDQAELFGPVASHPTSYRFLDRPDVSGGEALAALLRPGNAGSNTAADHITVLDLALAQLPEHARPTRSRTPSPWSPPTPGGRRSAPTARCVRTARSSSSPPCWT